MSTTNGVPAVMSPLDVLTLAEAAEYVRLPVDTVRAEAEAGRLPGRSVGGEWRFVRMAVADWLRKPGLPPLPTSSPYEGHRLKTKTYYGDVLPSLPVTEFRETPEEQAAFDESIRAYRDEIDRATGSGKYAPE